MLPNTVPLPGLTAPFPATVSDPTAASFFPNNVLKNPVVFFVLSATWLTPLLLLIVLLLILPFTCTCFTPESPCSCILLFSVPPDPLLLPLTLTSLLLSSSITIVFSGIAPFLASASSLPDASSFIFTASNPLRNICIFISSFSSTTPALFGASPPFCSPFTLFNFNARAFISLFSRIFPWILLNSESVLFFRNSTGVSCVSTSGIVSIAVASCSFSLSFAISLIPFSFSSFSLSFAFFPFFFSFLVSSTIVVFCSFSFSSLFSSSFSSSFDVSTCFFSSSSCSFSSFS
ncbi:hypothetical protein AX774_g5487 [Zancudomyces culisetae]|uniref:Uncharacterized protein n=1 Tax=Zancudomyces culisetae TaxID=1213189 RepID=A0A1R1PJF3_ZANCU|nr:hypothetical protein AX774_g5487 [Zancudomyces culisetae]|eukprot:OMH81063.1 hypothetical protein AX774_g5487 [Zancudomyces culisetae]